MSRMSIWCAGFVQSTPALTAVFRDRGGHRGMFQLRPGATSPNVFCP